MKQTLKPDDTLYIYYLKGIVTGIEKKFELHADFHGHWIEGDCSFLFFSSPADSVVEKASENSKDALLAEKFEMTLEEWHGENPHTYVLGDYCISPPWEECDALREGCHHIILYPGVVFGTGHHQTTRDCILAVQNLIKKKRVSTLLDIGTGTGVLSLTAAAAGADKIVACDLNLLAVQTALHNIRLNSFEKKIAAVQARGEEIINTPADAVVANIHYDAMKEIIHEQGFVEKRWFVLSGLLKTQSRKIVSALYSKGIKTVQTDCPEGVWCTITGETN